MAVSVKNGNPLVDSIERDVKMNSSADDVYDIFRNNCKLFPGLLPDDIQKVELLKPDWNSVGSVRRWTFVDADKCGIWKDVVEAIDDWTKSITWTLVDGKVPKELYRSLKVKYHFYTQCEGPTAHVTLTYEKKNANVPVPEDYMDFVCRMVKAAAKIATSPQALKNMLQMVNQ